MSGQKVKALFKKIGLPIAAKGLDVKDILSALRHDKKFIYGKTRFVLPVRIGKVAIREGVPERLIKEAIQAFL
jgi:3-dehydroquinate synthase